MLSREQLERYERNIVIDEVGRFGQEKLLAAEVLVVGAGGLGSPVLLYLAAAGVGRIGIIDYDEVSLSNLGRQVIHATDRIGEPKAHSARSRLSQLNPDVHVDVYRQRFTADNCSLVERYDVIVDATDNLGTRYLLSDACSLYDRPLVHGAVMGFRGEASVLCTAGAPCYRCLFPEPPQRRQEGPIGVLSPTPGVIGTIQAMEVIKLILGVGEVLRGELLLYDGLRSWFHRVKVAPRDDCQVCAGDRPTIDPADPAYTV